MLDEKQFNFNIMKISIWETNWVYEAYPRSIISNKTIWTLEVDIENEWDVIELTNDKIKDLLSKQELWNK